MLRMDTIVARATAPGRGAIALVRISGPEAARILETLIDGRDKGPLHPRMATLRRLADPDGVPLDHALVTHFPGPRSFTGEEMVEISCHGGPVVSRRIVESVLRLGGREAEPGEFTRRALVHGRIDLIQAEAIADLVDGESTALQVAAIHQLERGLSRRIAELRETLIGIEALLVQHLDFPEEDEPAVPIERIAEEASLLAAGIRRLLSSAPEGTRIREGALTVLAGAPNAGKSTLFNVLLGEERAIVTDVAGTTRDAIEAVTEVEGYPFRLVDTAGLRPDGGRIERIGMEVARRYLEGADLILLCLPPGSGVEEGVEALFPEGEESRRDRILPVRTKADLDADGEMAGEILRVSAESGAGIGALRRAMKERVFRTGIGELGGEGVVTRRRQSEALRIAAESVEAFERSLRDGVPVEIAAAELREAETALEGVIGIVPSEAVLDRVFRDFCIGK